MSEEKLGQLRSTALQERVAHATKRFPSALVRYQSEPVPLDNDEDSSLTPYGNEYHTQGNPTRFKCPTTEPRPATSCNAFSSGGVEIQSRDDLALGKREDLAHCLPLIRGGAACLLKPIGCAELEDLFPIWRSSDIRSSWKITADWMGHVCVG